MSDATSGPPIGVLFVCASDFTSPSEKQVLWLARELIGRGHRVMVSLFGDPASARAEGAEEVPALSLRWHRFLGGRPRAGDLAAARSFAPDLVHAWNSRPPVVYAARPYARATGAPVLVHWEDDEWGMLGGPSARSAPERVKLLLRRGGARVHPPIWNISTPRSLAWVARNAAGFDALSPALAQEVQERTGRDCAVILPVSPPEAWEESSSEQAPPLPAATEGSDVLLYTGDINFRRAPDARLAIEALAEVQRRDRRVTFVHAGRNTSGLDLGEAAAAAGARPETVHALGNVPYPQIPALLRKASILLQPGRLTSFNRLAMPSKLQSYLAAGTPCITFAAGSGELLEDRVEVLKTFTAEPTELADRIVELLSDDELRATLARNAPIAARRLFDPSRNAEAFLAHYRSLLAGERTLAGALADAQPAQQPG